MRLGLCRERGDWSSPAPLSPALSRKGRGSQKLLRGSRLRLFQRYCPNPPLRKGGKANARDKHLSPPCEGGSGGVVSAPPRTQKARCQGPVLGPMKCA